MNTRPGMLAAAVVAALIVGGLAGYGLTRHGGMSADMDNGADMAEMDGSAAPQSSGDGPCPGGAQPEYWVAPMDANFKRDAPGKSPMGMALVPECGGADDGTDVRISPQVVQNLGVRTASVTREPISQTVRAVGTVGVDEGSLRMVHTRAEGWLERVGVAAVGDEVAVGDLLYGLFAPKLVAAEREYLTAGNNRMLRAAAADRLRALGYTDDQIQALARRGEAQAQVEQRAPAALTVVALGARQGQFVMPGTQVMALADLSQVWLNVAVPEHQAGRIRVGQKAKVTVAAYPQRDWTAQVAHVYPQMDPATRSLRVRLVLANPDGVLKPDMFASVAIRTDPRTQVLTVPTNAVIRTGDGARVVRAVGDGGFNIVPVRTGLADGGRTEILEGLAADDRVVISGQFLIDSEANVDAEALRMAASNTPAGTATATVQSVDTTGRSVVLDHGPMQPMGADGMSMPAMTMRFGLADGVAVDALAPGRQVRVTVENPEPGTYTVTEIAPADAMDHGEMDHGEMDHGEMGHGEMDHSEMDHSEMDHSEMDHSEMDHGEMGHGEMDHGEMDHGGMDHGGMDHGGMDHGGMDHGGMDHGEMDHGEMDHGEMDHGEMTDEDPS